VRIAEISVHSCPGRSPGSGDVGGMNLYILALSDEMNKLGVSRLNIFARWHDPNEPEIITINKMTRLIHIRAGEPADTSKLDDYNCLPEFQANLLAFMKREEVKYDVIRSHYWTSALVAEQIKKQLGIPDVVNFPYVGRGEEPRIRH